MKTKTIKFFLLIIFFSSCGKNNNTLELTKLQEEEIKIQKDLAEKKVLDSLSKKYNADTKFETVDYEMTYKYQELLDSNNRVIIQDYDLEDIEKNDTNYRVSINLRYQNKYIDFTCNKFQADQLDIEKNPECKDYEKILIIEISKLSKVKFQINSYGNSSDDYTPSTIVEVNPSDQLYCEGKLIDIYLK